MSALDNARANERTARVLLLQATLGLHWVRGHRDVVWWSGITVLASAAAMAAPAILLIAFVACTISVTLLVKLFRGDHRIRAQYGNIGARRSTPGWPTRGAIRGAEAQCEHARELHGRALNALSILEDQ